MATSANFGDTIMEGQIAPSVQVQNPVDDKSGQYLAEAANSLFTGIGEITGGIFKNAQEDEANGVLVNYRQDALLIADAIDQGSLSLQAGQTRLRHLYGEYLGNNPSLAKELDSVHSTILGDNGIANIVKTGNIETQRLKKLQDEAFGAGWGNDVDGYNNFLNTTRALETRSKQISLASAERGYTTAVEQDELKKGLNNWATAGMPWVDKTIAEAATLIDGGANPGEVLTQLKADIGTVMGDLSVNSQGMDIAHITGPIEKRLAAFEDFVSGTTDTATLKARLDAIGAQQQYSLLADDEELAELMALSELLGQGASVFVEKRLSVWSAKKLAGLTAPYDAASDTNRKPEDIIGSDGETVAALETAKELLTKAADNPTPELTSEVNNVIVNSLRALKTYNGEGVKDYRAAIDFFADPSVAKWIENGQLIIPADLSDNAKRVVQAQYEDVLLPIVEDRWLRDQITLRGPSDGSIGGAMGMGTGGSNRQVTFDQIADPVWNGMSVSFVPKPEYANDRTVVETVKRLNTGEDSIAGPLNTLIRAKAHMNGSTDYGAEWSFFEGRLFPEPVEGEGGAVEPLAYAPQPERGNAASAAIAGATFDPMGVNPEDVSLATFNEDLDAVYATVEQTAAVDPQAMTTATSPIEVAQAYLGLTETNAEHNKTLAAFIKETAGVSINPAKTAWCAAFVDAILHSTGASGTGKLNARSYLDWGKVVKEPKVGDVVVLSRGDPNGWQGHVGFYMGTNPDGTIRILGGNQGNSVSEQDFDAGRVLGFRRA